MSRVLVVHHSPGRSLPAMLRAVLDGAGAEGIEGVEVHPIEALTGGTEDVLAADAYVLLTPANLGYMSGALKHFFDTVYNDSLDVTAGRPWAMVVHGESDTTGAVASIDRVVTGLRWTKATGDVTVIGPPTDDDIGACWNLGATLAAELMD